MGSEHAYLASGPRSKMPSGKLVTYITTRELVAVHACKALLTGFQSTKVVLITPMGFPKGWTSRCKKTGTLLLASTDRSKEFIGMALSPLIRCFHGLSRMTGPLTLGLRSSRSC